MEVARFDRDIGEPGGGEDAAQIVTVAEGVWPWGVILKIKWRRILNNKWRSRPRLCLLA
jgi:hypothetical protein